jgi:putative hydrolase
MSLLEGFSDYVMDEVGKDLVPGVERISAKFHERRHARRSPFERAVMRLTGMDVKLEQYAKGEAFVSAIAAAGGSGALNRLWAGPEMLPRHGEIDDPSAWLARAAAASDASPS